MLLEDKVASGATIVADQRGLIGLRGLYNLGNTYDTRHLNYPTLIVSGVSLYVSIAPSVFVSLDRCFMSVVLQSLLHNPMMRDFFLSDMHNRKNCAFKFSKPRFYCFFCQILIFPVLVH
jgi:hypothetical protein